MGKLIGIDTGFNYFDNDLFQILQMRKKSKLKTDAFLFDNLVIPGIKSFLDSYYTQLGNYPYVFPEYIKEYLSSYFSDVQYLFDEGYIVDTQFGTDELIKNGLVIPDYTEREPLYYFDLRVQEGYLMNVTRMLVVDQDYGNMIVQKSIQLYKNENNLNTYIPASPVWYMNPLNKEESSIQTNYNNVINLIIDDISVPSDELDWETILGLRKDEKLMRSLHKLRLWMKKVSTQGLTNDFLLEEYLDLKYDYETYMKLVVKHIKKGLFESLFTLTGETVENVLKLKFGNLSKLPFQYKHRQLQIEIEELKAPGKEIGYIYQLNSKFD